MAYLGKKYLLLLAALITLFLRNVNFYAAEFDPLRSQLEHVTNSKYYTEYVAPVHQKVESHIVPSISKANSALLDKYQVYLAAHVQSASDSLASHSSKFEKVAQLKSHVDPYWKITTEYTEKYTQLIAEKIAIGIIKAEEWTTICAAHTKNYFDLALIHTKSTITALKPEIVNFYENTVTPLAISSFEKTKKFVIELYTYIVHFYSTKISPEVDDKFAVYVKPHYEKHLQSHIEKATIQARKYYKLLKLEIALNLSKNLIAGTYEQASNYFKSKSTEVNTEEEPTTAALEDEPTSFLDTETLNIEETPSVEDQVNEEQAVEVGTEKVVPSNSANEVQTEGNTEVIVSLAQEISTWRDFIHSKVESISKNFDKDILNLEQTFLSELQPKVTKKLQDFRKTLDDDYAIINRDIYSIDSRPFLLESGEEVEIDSHDNILEKKITREEFRALLNGKKEVPSKYADEIHNFTISQIQSLEKLIDDERRTIVEIYEEFAEVAINEFSKKMMYSTFASEFNKLNDNEDDSENYQDWKEYIKVKNYLIDQREALISKRQDLEATKKYISEIQMTLKVFVHEAGNHYALLRAKANIEFQERERREREEAERLETEESPIETSTVLKYVTLTEGEVPEAQETSIDIEAPSDEELSDLESDEEDFETPADSSDDVPDESEEEVVVEEPSPELEDAVEHIEDEEAVVVEESSPELEDIVEHHEDSDVAVEESDLVEHEPEEENSVDESDEANEADESDDQDQDEPETEEEEVEIEIEDVEDVEYEDAEDSEISEDAQDDTQSE